MAEELTPALVWEGTEISVIEIQLPTERRRALALRHKLSWYAGPQQGQKEATPQFVIGLDEARSVANQLLEAVSRAERMALPPQSKQ